MMQLGTRVVLVALGGVMITATASMLVQRWTIRKQGEEMIRDTMRTTILGAENTRQSVSKMRLEHMFADEALKNEAANTRDYTKTKLYETVPVVAAWNSIAATADKQGYIFRVPSEDPRNPKNLPTEHEQYILNELTSKALPEYYEVDEKNNQVLFARPITLTGDCMVCHGDPATSPSRNGKDMLGFQMEGWHEGDHHGMFLLRSDLSKVDAVANAGMLKTALWLVPLTVLIAFGVFFFISAISKRLMALVISLSEGTEQVADAVSQISTANQALSAQTTSQAAALEETSAASEQITGLTRQNAQSSKLAAEQMDRVDDQVKESHKALSELDDSMKEIQSSSHRIEQIIKVIDGIAFQTNILALNAAVEAARAGSAGAGFSVVADEVRSLAQKSSQAARDTAPLIEESINKTLTGGVKLQTVVAAIERISVNASKARSLVADVSLGSQQQATGMAEVAQSVCKMQEGTQANAAGSEQSAAASEQLAAQAATMNDIAQQLRMVVEG